MLWQPSLLWHLYLLWQPCYCVINYQLTSAVSNLYVNFIVTVHLGQCTVSSYHVSCIVAHIYIIPYIYKTISKVGLYPQILQYSVCIRLPRYQSVQQLSRGKDNIGSGHWLYVANASLKRMMFDPPVTVVGWMLGHQHPFLSCLHG